MSRLLVRLVLGTLGYISMCQCFRLAKNDGFIPSGLPDFKSMRIINGDAADIRDFPYIASLQYNGTFYGHDFDHYCCGSILNEEWIITSAQCGQARPPKDFHVRVGSSKYYQNGEVYFVEKVVVHPQFDAASNDYDVALIKLSSKILFTESVKPISLPSTSSSGGQEKASLSIAGWGATEILGKISDDLRDTEIERISAEECRSAYGALSITPRMFCVFRQGAGPCVGDSGSPAVLDNRIIGVTSWSDGCAYVNPTVYASVSSVLPWIKLTAGIGSSA